MGGIPWVRLCGWTAGVEAWATRGGAAGLPPGPESCPAWGPWGASRAPVVRGRWTRGVGRARGLAGPRYSPCGLDTRLSRSYFVRGACAWLVAPRRCRACMRLRVHARHRECGPRSHPTGPGCPRAGKWHRAAGAGVVRTVVGLCSLAFRHAVVSLPLR